MTSYATNETTSTANTLAAPVESDDATMPPSAVRTPTTTSPPPLLTPPTSPPDCNNLTSKMAATASTLLPRNAGTNNCDDFDCDSLSDGHEKADTTPENLKKIDDVIEQEQQQQQQQQRRSLHYPTTADCATSPLGVGLAAAIDDSNAKYCFVNPLRSPRDTQSNNSELRIESSSDSSACVTPSTMPESNNSNSNNYTSSNNVSNNADRIADNSEAHDDDSSASNTTTTATKQSYAFTIDNFNEKDCDPAATAAKYRNMLERFQSRHRRGASMSKLEGEATKETLTTSASAMPLTQRNSRNACESTVAADSDAPKVKLRVRDRSTSRVRDAAKRHSWSPRSSSTQESLQQSSKQTAMSGQQKSTLPPTTMRKSAAPTKTKQLPPPLQMPKGAANLIANRTQFTPRSTAMQMALQKVDFLTAPLGDYKHLSAEDADNISEAGTYTLDGDNYTEEQKDLMNIDKNARMRARQRRPKDLDLNPNEPTKIPVHVSNNNRNSSNVLEVNYYHDAAELPQPQSQSPRYKPNANDLIMSSHQSAGAYLEKIKSRVLRNMSATKNDDITSVAPAPPAKYSGEGSKPSANDDDDDMGCFTSVTTSGVLAKQGALDPRPRLTRKSSLSTSQIDSSEYVSNETKLKNPQASAYAAGGFTDHQKAEYRLNLFTNQKDAQKFAATRSYIESPPDTPTAKLSDTALLKTAATKNDWIQEWARNARARSLANENYQHQRATPKDHHDPCGGELMTRSYTGGGCADSSLTDDSIYSKQCAAASAKLNKTLAERYRLAGECDYSSDPLLHASSVRVQPSDAICKPPKSPSKIPSPLHSLGRARSASRTRAPLQNMLPPNDDDADDDYLQRTAAAINSLQQSLSRKNSLKSPTPHSASPRAHSARSHPPLYSPSPEDCASPQHSLGSPTSAAAVSYRSPLQRRNLSNAAQLQLMTSSFNEQQLALLTSGEYLMKQMRMRKNSFDGNMAGGNSPARRAAAAAAAAAQASRAASGDQELSPLRRSSSFSAKIAASAQRAPRPNFANIYTPPAARHNYSVAPQLSAASNAQAALKKSASSNNFSQVYSDYDDNLQYYINDEDDMEGGGNNDEYYSSGAEDDDEITGSSYFKGEESSADVAAVPLSNTRYNKALLMRIERSKQKVSTGKVSSAPPMKSTASATTSAGVVACPNTPELPRRGIKSAPRAGAARQSVPRDTSLSRLANQVPNSLASAKKQLLQTAAAVPTTTTTATRSSSNQRVQPKYLDISKYKPVQGNNFLRKNDAKSTLKTPSSSSTTTIDAMKRSPSSSSMGLSRTDPSRVSNRSMRSVGSCMTTSATSLGGSGRASSAVRRDASITKQKEAEMAMWKRRSTYDPMKAAAEDRRKKDEAKRLALAKLTGDALCERPSRSPFRRGHHF